ncbi:MAG: M28 family peptidase [Lysobacterales bacterium]|jgi:hypothetical protein
MRYPPILLALALFASAAHAQDVIYHHDLVVEVDPATSLLTAADTITFPEGTDLSGLVFSLHGKLEPTSRTDGVTLVETGAGPDAADKGMDQEDYTSVIERRHYRVEVDGRQPDALTLVFSGAIHHPVRQANEEYARGFSQSPGLIDPLGVYLAGSTSWVPSFGEEYVTYSMEVQTPAGWRSVSQGKRTEFSESGDFRTDVWEVTTPTEEIFVIAAQFTEYEYAMGNVKAMAFLREKDDGLANKYLETTAQYMEMYRELVGPYPYSKFALVENFWETGYGMPSFTLLGPQIIRFPFILHSSYPHELLHNWWGNGVFVDFETGNWCEGLTAYMADHLIAEQRGTGAEYRRTTLQGYTDYVTAENEFPLSEFLSRSDASSSSIGYGKTAMVFDMLREQVGDENFSRALQRFYRDNKFRRAGFDDIRAAFEEVTGEQLGPYFEQWVERPGAPELAISDHKLTKGDGHSTLEIELEQVQDGEVFDLKVPIVVYSAEQAERELVSMTQKKQRYSFTLDCDPLRVEIDPQFNVMRRLDYREVPPSLSKMFGAEKVLMVLPSKAAAGDLEKYRALANTWKDTKSDEFSVVLDAELKELPADSGVWILGWENSWIKAVKEGLADYDAEINRTTVRFGATSHDAAENSFVVALRHPHNTDLAMTWLTINEPEAVAGLARKLPHYGKYSYLGFTGDEPTNSAKGQWPAVGSPLAADLQEYTVDLPQLEKRPALATLAPVFNAERMKADVLKLASGEMQGRVPGSGGHEASAEYIAAQFEAAGLQPAGDDGTWFQAFEMTGPDDETVTVRNVLGVIPGNNADWQDQSVVLSAHYDHLGLGWPDVKAGNEGQVHFGADDNASGVAVMLELARTLGKSMEPARAVVFAAFTGEEAGLKGARHYVGNMQRYPAEKAMGNLNIDTVGRLGDNKLLVLGSASAREWKFIFMGASFVTGVETEMPTQELDASDQVAFIEAGVPGVQFFGGVSPDYHKPSDTADKLDYNGLVKVAAVVREGVSYLAEREEPMSFNAPAKPPGASHPAAGAERTASTGLMPDFAFSGEGVSIADPGNDTPAHKAGLRKGDVITAINGTGVTDLRSYSNMLKQFGPGDTIEVAFTRDGAEQTTELTLRAR